MTILWFAKRVFGGRRRQQVLSRGPSAMTILDHAERALREAGGGPLPLREIADRMLENGWTTASPDPPGNVGTSLADDVKRGANSRFVRVAPGMYALNPTVQR